MRSESVLIERIDLNWICDRMNSPNVCQHSSYQIILLPIRRLMVTRRDIKDADMYLPSRYSRFDGENTDSIALLGGVQPGG